MIDYSESAFAGRRILLISPHADDVAYSIGGLVARLAPVADLSLLTVFSRSGWALPVELRRQGVDAVTRARQEEDRVYCARYGIGLSDLALDDSFVAGLDEREELSFDPAHDLRTRGAVDAIADFARAHAPDLVLAPAAIGGHVDHRIAHEAARAIAGVETLYYEDIPYSADRSLVELDRAMAAQGLRPALFVDIGEFVEHKADAMWDYRSQVCAAAITEMIFHARRIAGGAVSHAERLWRH